jgi:hypothetical protein
MLGGMLQYECQEVELGRLVVKELAINYAMHDRAKSGWKLESTAALNDTGGATRSVLLFWSKPPDHQTGSAPQIGSG